MARTARTTLGLLALTLTLLVAACGGEGNAGDAGKLSLVAYSTPKDAYEEIVPAFAKTPDDSGVTFSQSYGNSGDQARAVIAGLPADIVALSLEPDVTKLVDEQLVAPGWDATPTRASSRARSSRSRCARATRRTSAAGPTSSSRASRC